MAKTKKGENRLKAGRRTPAMNRSEQTTGGMRRFAALAVHLGTSTKTNDKLEALETYFSEAEDADKVWVIALFSGRRPKRTVNTTQLWEWCREITGLPGWLFEESYHTVGDLAETIALLLPEGVNELGVGGEGETGSGQRTGMGRSLAYYLEALAGLSKEDEPTKKAFVQKCWASMDKDERFVFNKLITGGFRIGISQQTVVNALARATAVEAAVIAHRISGDWDPATTSYSVLLSGEGGGSDLSRPYPFYLAYALEGELDALGKPEEWQAEWKWDGIRGQLIRRNPDGRSSQGGAGGPREGPLFVWSRGEELMTEKFPEYQAFRERLPAGTVLDGEIIGMGTGGAVGAEPAAAAIPAGGPLPFVVLPFAALQTRIGRKNVTKKNLSEAPVGFIAYDLLEYGGEDWRSRPLVERRRQLEAVIAAAGHPLLQLSPVIAFDHWEELAQARAGARDRGSEGLMLKRKDSIYQVGRRRGDWWKWKIDPLVIDAVLVYAQKGHGRRSNLYTDYTFAVRSGDQLVTFTKAYSGLTDKELAEVDAFVKKNSLEKFGPVRTVRPELVFEIAFEGIAASARHKSGVALRFPRINRWRRDKTPADIDTLEALKKMLELYGK
ncbi:MAG TPA: ATP-dependent DNA ligase [Puia sp.]|nr:ATP-dependent DNA ligase [Puia sp.]